ncbi:hypothetical protein [Cupriavidus alkaliphilus]|uniref:Uncharacterized protein n=1 Tax=Cupriavidus alkaliphilus TaxID=942866 RepID=A0A7W4YU90_9BURK|nr:hypothetical protein [Cupriavidus alkaliphilus]MBB3009991.1 hypothetical protein [Cupriavidus alkaliphilus]
MEIEFNYNLSYFYLGRAAEGLGYEAAAETYYLLAANTHQCVKYCDGFVFPRDINLRFAAMRAAKLDREKTAKGEQTRIANEITSSAQGLTAVDAVTDQSKTWPERTLMSQYGEERMVVADVRDQARGTPVPLASQQAAKVIPKGYRGNSIVDLIKQFERLDKLAEDEFTKKSVLVSKGGDLRSKTYRFVFKVDLNSNYGSEKRSDGAYYDAESETLHLNLWSRSHTFYLNKSATGTPEYQTISLLETRQSSDYIGQNAFGVKANIHSRLVNQYGLALNNFSGSRYGSIFSTSITLHPVAAKALKSDLMFYVDVVLISREPGASVLKTVSGRDATISNPSEFYLSSYYLVATAKEIGVFKKSTGEILAWKAFP